MLLDEQSLLSWTHYQRRGDLERFLRNAGVRYFTGRDGAICTTLSAVEVAMGVRTEPPRQAPPATPDFR